MNAIQTEQIRRMRHAGSGYSRIAQSLGLSENTVKTYYKRNALGGISAVLPNPGGVKCRNRGKPNLQVPGRKKRGFCSPNISLLTVFRHRQAGTSGSAVQ